MIMVDAILLLSVPAVVALVQVIRTAAGPRLRDRFVPLVSLAVAVLLTLAAGAADLEGMDQEANVYEETLSGVFLGMTSSGLYSGTKALSQRGGPPPTG